MDKKIESLKGGPHNKAAFDELRGILNGVKDQLSNARRLSEDANKFPDYIECILVKSGISGIEKAVSEMEDNLTDWEKEICVANEKAPE